MSDFQDLSVLPPEVQQLLVSKNLSPMQQDWSPLLHQEETELPYIKEEQEELWSSQESEQLQGLQEADIIKVTFDPVSVKFEDDEEKLQSSQFHQNLTGQMEMGAAEDCGGSEAARNTDPERDLEPVTEVKIEDSSEPETGDCKNVKATMVNQSDSKSEERDKRKKTEKKTHSCSLCGEIFNKKSNLTRHLRIHTGETPFSCSECNKTFSRKASMVDHMRTHTEEKPFSCSECVKTFQQESDLKAHTAHHRGEKPFSCSVCDQRFFWPSQLNKHNCDGDEALKHHQDKTKLKTEAEMGPHDVDCGGPEQARSSDLEGDLQLDIKVKTEDFSEPETDDSIDWKETMKQQSSLNLVESNRDMRLISNKKMQSCSQCGKSFKFKWSLIIHMRTHKRDKDFTCSECGTVNQSGNMCDHMRKLARKKTYSCSVCNQKFKHKVSMTRHMITHTRSIFFSCFECGKRFTQKGNLTRHMRSHTGDKPFSCSECGKRFNRKLSLTAHMAQHGQERPFICLECGKSFIYNAHLTDHMRIHTGEKPFICSECGKRFAYKGSLKKHTITHTGEKPFSCSGCAKSFKDKANLNKHMRIHTGERPLSCSTCDQRFSWYSQLRRHKCAVGHASEPSKRQTKLKRKKVKGADVENSGGSHKARNSEQGRQLQAEIEVSIEDYSEPETDDFHDSLKNKDDLLVLK